MRIDIDRVGNATIIELPGKSLDASNTKSFRDAVDSYVEPDAQIVFDLQQLSFVDSSGLGAFLSLLRDLTAKGGEMKLCGMDDAVVNMFSLVRMDRVFAIHPTRDEAIAAF